MRLSRKKENSGRLRECASKMPTISTPKLTFGSRAARFAGDVSGHERHDEKWKDIPNHRVPAHAQSPVPKENEQRRKIDEISGLVDGLVQFELFGGVGGQMRQLRVDICPVHSGIIYVADPAIGAQKGYRRFTRSRAKRRDLAKPASLSRNYYDGSTRMKNQLSFRVVEDFWTF